MSVPRLLITDVDRTLLTHDHVLPQRVANAVGAAREAGMSVVLATARSPQGVKSYAEQLGVARLVICFNGAWIGDVSTGVARMDQRIARPEALEVMAAANDGGIRPMWFAAGAIHALAYDPVVAREAGVTGEPVEIAGTLAGLPGEPGKIMCVAADPAERAHFETVRTRFGARLSISSSHRRFLEIGPQGVSKRAAAEVVAARLGIDPRECAAAGDAENDLEMLTWAGVAVTVENAVPQARGLAGFVAASCDEGGLADAVAWLLEGRPALSAV